jgi:hypothetical protein
VANQLLSIGSTLYEWGMLFGLAKSNPFAPVPWLEVPDRGHIPWPQRAVDHVRGHAPPDLARMVRLGIMTCQRESDFVRMGPQHRESVRGKPGIWCRAEKTRRRRRSACIPITTVDAIELDRWAGEAMQMTWGRWKRPVRSGFLQARQRALYGPHDLLNAGRDTILNLRPLQVLEPAGQSPSLLVEDALGHFEDALLLLTEPAVEAQALRQLGLVDRLRLHDLDAAGRNIAASPDLDLLHDDGAGLSGPLYDLIRAAGVE